MANAVDDGGGAGSGGTPASMCAISPSDLIGTIGNLITRIEKMEQILSQLLGANLAANSLSDISQLPERLLATPPSEIALPAISAYEV